jgi:hypothetical protein
MGIKPGSEKSSIRVPTPAKPAPSAPSPGMQKLAKEAAKLPGQVRAMSQAVKQAPGAPGKPKK